MLYKVICLEDNIEVYTGTYEDCIAFVEANSDHQLAIECAD